MRKLYRVEIERTGYQSVYVMAEDPSEARYAAEELADEDAWDYEDDATAIQINRSDVKQVKAKRRWWSGGPDGRWMLGTKPVPDCPSPAAPETEGGQPG